ncbi:hypothetical protein I553_4165 [Mycobacterium xenopi 4042]|uniref:Uncharacterized protein n=1 Tax=Mycobacterium xenopi 4042 TaxID=1299334 RepID=X8AFH3_MYCXE|nr:hypothetical protein I553_4165 [Mycobacterium xenopi 4042]
MAGGADRPLRHLRGDGVLAAPFLTTSGASALFFIGVLVVGLLGGVAQRRFRRCCPVCCSTIT